VVADPYPSEVLGRVRDRIDLRPATAETLEPEAFAELERGDLLFIDTTHTLRPGGDVIRLLLERVPALAPGVLVHVHDFFRPFEYPRVLPEVFGVYWQEHYLLQAFLAFNTDWTVLFANHALARLEPARVRGVIPALGPEAAPSALWLERR
jgi:hypothetical protein